MSQHSGFITKIYQHDITDIGLNEMQPLTRLQPIAWPSEALAQLGPIAVGECKRCMFYKILGSRKTEPVSITSKCQQEAGKMYEAFHVDKFKEYGLFKDAQVPIVFKIPDSKNNILVNGRMDLIIENDNIRQGIEIKSVSEYKAVKIMGSSSSAPLPSVNNLMQVMLYKYYLSHTEEGKKQDIAEVYLMYINRSSGSTFYYKVDLDTDGYAILTAFDQSGKEIYILSLKDVESYDTLLIKSGINERDAARLAELRVSIKDIFAKYDLTYDCVNNKMIPERDYKIKYTLEDIEQEYRLGRISKIKYNKAKKGEPLGDNKCTYCSYKTKCLSDSGINL